MTSVWSTPQGGEAVRARYAQFLQHWPAANAQLRLPTAQGETFVIASGPQGAPTVLLLHGGAANSASWMGDVATWARSFRVYAVDMIGEPGLSAPSRPPLESEAYALWLYEVLAGLGIERAALVGISLGGWLALDYATRRPERVSALALLCPGGVGRQRNVLLWAAPLMLFGAWGRRFVMRRLGAGAISDGASPAIKAFAGFMDLIQANFRPRTRALPRFADEALRRLAMPVLAILGGKDAMLDSAGTRRRLAANVPHAEIRWLPDDGHFLFGHAQTIDAFLRQALAP
jgi:pimeloyl-ACP methyl ester carboxylesterase